MNMMKNYPLWTAMVTPMMADGTIDFESFENLLVKQEEAGAGVLVLGSTGEGLNLTGQEKKDVVRFAKSLNLKVPLMAGLGGFHLEAQKEFIGFCDQVGVDAFLLVTPLYAKPGKEGQYEWFHALMSETETPCMIYNVPSRTGVKLHPEVPARLQEAFDHVLGVKEASGNINEFKAFREHAPDVDFYSGDDGLTRAFTEEGAAGLVSVASNAWPEQTMRYLRLCLEKKYDRLFTFWTEATDALFAAPNPIPAKVLLQHKSWIANESVRPPLSVKDISPEMEEALLEADRRIHAWFEAQAT